MPTDLSLPGYQPYAVSMYIMYSLHGPAAELTYSNGISPSYGSPTMTDGQVASGALAASTQKA